MNCSIYRIGDGVTWDDVDSTVQVLIFRKALREGVRAEVDCWWWLSLSILESEQPLIIRVLSNQHWRSERLSVIWLVLLALYGMWVSGQDFLWGEWLSVPLNMLEYSCACFCLLHCSVFPAGLPPGFEPPALLEEGQPLLLLGGTA